MTSIDIVSLVQLSPPFAFVVSTVPLCSKIDIVDILELAIPFAAVPCVSPFPPFLGQGIWVDPVKRTPRKRMTPPPVPDRIDYAEELLIEIT